MKIRTDFVTNSSSSSYSAMSVTVKGKDVYLVGDDKEYFIDECFEGPKVDANYFPSIVDGKLIIEEGSDNVRINTISDLMAWLFVAAHNDYSVEDARTILGFANNKIFPRDFIKYSEEELGYDFNDLEYSDDTPDEELRGKIIEEFFDAFDIEFDSLEPYVQVMNDADNLKDIDDIWMGTREHIYDEGVNDLELYYPDISELPDLEKEAGEKFPKIKYGEEGYYDAVDRWEQVLRDKVSVFGHMYSEFDTFEQTSLSGAIGAGIEEGDYNRIWECIGDEVMWFEWSREISGKDIK